MFDGYLKNLMGRVSQFWRKFEQIREKENESIKYQSQKNVKLRKLGLYRELYFINPNFSNFIQTSKKLIELSALCNTRNIQSKFIEKVTVFFKKQACEIDKFKFNLKMDLRVMAESLTAKGKILEDFFINFRDLKANYKEYLGQLEIFSWSKLELQIKEIEGIIRETDLADLKN